MQASVDRPVQGGAGDFPSGANLESIQRRKPPRAFIVDRRGSVVLATQSNDDAMPADIAKVVTQLMAQAPTEEHVFLASSHKDVVQLTPLKGSEQPYSLVLIMTYRKAGAMRASLRSKGLTKREAEVVHMLASGLQTHQIALSLDIAKSTVIQHVKSAMSKMHAHGRVELIVKATGSDFAIPNAFSNSELPSRQPAMR